jgi:ketosteroid isomerase-like protein
MGEIVANNVLWGDALVRGDSTRLASLYTDDAALMGRPGDVTGKSAIVTTLMSGRRVDGDSIHGTATSTDQLDVAGDRAYEAGTITYTLVSSDGTPRKVTVRYVNFWRRASGGWQLSRSLRPLP